MKKVYYEDFDKPEVFKADIKRGKLKHFKCFLPLPNGKERIELGDYFFVDDIDPRGQDALTYLDGEHLFDAIEQLEQDAPFSTPEDFWKAYDLCRVEPYRLIWELLSPEVALKVIESKAKAFQEFLKNVNEGRTI